MEHRESKKVILDACCGARMFWFDKTNPDVLYADIRVKEFTCCDGRKVNIAPDEVVDFQEMPFGDKSFKLVVFDPPHLVQAGACGWLSQKYGSLPRKGWESYIKAGFEECWRVLDDYGTLIFKWNETDIPVPRIIKAIGREPLFGNKCGKTSRTHWMCFMKMPK